MVSKGPRSNGGQKYKIVDFGPVMLLKCCNFINGLSVRVDKQQNAKLYFISFIFLLGLLNGEEIYKFSIIIFKCYNIINVLPG